MVALADGVDRSRPERLVLGGRLGDERRPVLGEHVPFAARELRLGTKAGREAVLPGLSVRMLALAVDGHRRGDEDLADAVAARDDLLEKGRAAERVDRGIALDLVHGLPHSHRGREVDDGVGVVHRLAERVMVADIRDDELDRGVEIVRALPAFVHLRVEVVQRAHLVALGEEPVGEMRADEAGSSGDEDAHSSNAIGAFGPRPEGERAAARPPPRARTPRRRGGRRPGAESRRGRGRQSASAARRRAPGGRPAR